MLGDKMLPSLSTYTLFRNNQCSNISGVTPENVPEAHLVFKMRHFFSCFDNKFDDEMFSGA
jgi:hypothetical protein